MAKKNIPKGYETARYQGFKTFEEPDALLIDYCRICANACASRVKLGYAQVRQADVWDSKFIRITPKKPTKTLTEQVICLEFDKK